MRRPSFRGAVVLLLVASALTMACTDSGSTPTEISAENIESSGDEVFIVDQVGKRWNVTHARDRYGMDPAGFQFGLGQDAIPPIIDPTIIHEGDAGYPQDFLTFLVIGTTLGGDSRAYELQVMASVEIVDESFAGTHVAVAY